VRARVEHVFGDQKNGMGTGIVRTIGIVRARCKTGMTNLVYNMRRFVCSGDRPLTMSNFLSVGVMTPNEPRTNRNCEYIALLHPKLTGT
jgi:hypothetical protein